MKESPCKSCGRWPVEVPDCFESCELLPHLKDATILKIKRYVAQKKRVPRAGEVEMDDDLRYFLLEEMKKGVETKTQMAVSIGISRQSLNYFVKDALNARKDTILKLQAWREERMNKTKEEDSLGMDEPEDLGS